MPFISTTAVRAVAEELLHLHGAPTDIAGDVAEHVVLAERSGHASHGLSILPSYLDAVKAGLLSPTAGPTLLQDKGAVLQFDAHRGYGQHAGKVAVSQAIARAQQQGACFLTIKNSYHLGRAGHYGEMAASAGLVYLSFVNIVGRPPTVAPFGGTQARLSTNPLCFAAPIADGRAPFLLDYATSAIAANKVRLMAASGEAVPPGMLIDGEGKPTRDAHALLAEPHGALLPFGGHKGYALGFLAELLAGVLSGGETISPIHPRDGGLRNNLFAIVFDPLSFGGGGWQQSEAAAFTDYVTACPRSSGQEKVMVPGEPEADLRSENLHAVQMTDSGWALFADCARSSGLRPEACLLMRHGHG